MDRLIEQATGDNVVLSSYALSQLDYLLSAGLLTIEQTSAARAAIEAVVSNLEEAVDSGHPSDNGSTVDSDGASKEVDR